MANDLLQFRGDFHLNVIKDGKVIDRIVEKNLIVDAGFGLVQSLMKDGLTADKISKICFGNVSGSTIDEPQSDWTDVPNLEVTKGISSVTFPTVRSVSFNWTLLSNEGNGNSIAYYGLKSEGGTLFAAKSRAAIEKTADIVLEGTWVIHY